MFSENRRQTSFDTGTEIHVVMPEKRRSPSGQDVFVQRRTRREILRVAHRSAPVRPVQDVGFGHGVLSVPGFTRFRDIRSLLLLSPLYPVKPSTNISTNNVNTKIIKSIILRI